MALAPTRTEVAALAADQETNPVALAHALDAATGREWRDWLPETLCDYARVTDADVQQRDKLCATQVVSTNPDVFSDWHLFLACVIAFNHRRVNFGWLDKPTIPELAWGCVVMNKLCPAEAYGEGVIRFIASDMIAEGLTFFPWIGGDGLVLGAPGQTWTKGLIDAEKVSALGHQVQKIWLAGELAELDPSAVDDHNSLHVQLADIVRAQKYIRSQKPEVAP